MNLTKNLRPGVAGIKYWYNFASPNFGVVVQLVRISACHAEGRGFESRPHRTNS